MSSEPHPFKPVNHVFVDCENVKKFDPGILGGRTMRFHLFFGPQQKRLDIDVVQKLVEHATTVELIRSMKSGSNALDFVLAYHLGREVLAEPEGYFHIIAKDTGYGALVELLQSRNVKIRQHPDLESFARVLNAKHDLPVAPQVNAVTKPIKKQPSRELSPIAAKILEILQKSEKSRPKKHKALLSLVGTHCGKDQPAELAKSIVEELQKAGILRIGEKELVRYPGILGSS